MEKNIIDKYCSFYFAGIGGVSMSALAKILISLGKRVGGFDRCGGEIIEGLIKIGADVTVGNYGQIDGYEAVVYTDAIPESNLTITEAVRTRKPLISRGELLSSLSGLFKNTVAVAGCHGKTTCTAMLTHVFAQAGLRFCAHIGGEDLTYSNAYLIGFDYLITEACEYKKNFLFLKPSIAIILNSDADHLDCYGNVDNLKKTYAQFAENSGEVIGLYGDAEVGEKITFGYDDRAFYHAEKIKNVKGRYSFTAYEGDVQLGRICLDVYGKHNILNALAAVAAARRCGICFEDIQAGIYNFKGVKRRFEKIGSYNGADCIADYAHHPNELKAAIKTAKALTEGELYIIFQPHTYSRTKNLFRQFVSVLSQRKKLLIYKTYAAREYYDDAGSALTLSGAVKRSRYGDCAQDICNFISRVVEGDIILFLGAGDIYDIAKLIVRG